MDNVLGGKPFRVASMIVVIFLAAVMVLSSYYYRAFVMEPAEVWHGANMGARALLSGGRESESPIDMALVSRVSDKLEKGQFSRPVQDSIDVSEMTQKDFEIKNQIAANQARETKLQQDIGRLEQINQQLLNSKSVLDTLNQDYSSLTAHNEIEAARRAAIIASLEDNLQAFSEADAQALISNRRANDRSANPVPQKVLDNLQKATGISPEEINELMNR